MENRLKSIKEKAKESSLGYDEVQAPAIGRGFLLGANYVLECIEEATSICFDEELLSVIRQLKKEL